MRVTVRSKASSTSSSTSSRNERQTKTFVGRRGSSSTPARGMDKKSPGASPIVTDASSNTSATDEPQLPCVEKPIQRGRTLRPIAPMVGLYPTSPQNAAGSRVLPPPSDVVASGTSPAASAAAEPPDDPPGEKAGFHGFRVVPCSVFVVIAAEPNSGLLVRPITMAPAAFKRATTTSSTSSGGASANSFDPSVVRRPFTRAMSLTRTGKPASAPVRGCEAACAKASSA